MARKRNYQWTMATRFEGSITQDKAGGSTQSVTPEVLEARLIEDGFALDTDLPAPSSAAPQDLGTTNSGSSANYSRADHRHKMPSLEDIGAVALGETSATAYRGDRGKTAYDHSQITGANPHATTAAQVGAMPVLDLTGSPSTLDFNSINGGQPCIAAVQWTRDLAVCHAPFDQDNFGAGTLYQTLVGGLLTQMVIGARWTSTPNTAEGSSMYTRAYVSGAWSAWHGAWSDANLVGTRNEHNHFSMLTKSESYDFTNITASLIKHANGDVIGTLSGGVPGRSYTVVSVASMILGIPSGVTLYGTSGQWAGPSSFALGGMRPITIQCMDPFTWLLPNYG